MAEGLLHFATNFPHLRNHGIEIGRIHRADYTPRREYGGVRRAEGERNVVAAQQAGHRDRGGGIVGDLDRVPDQQQGFGLATAETSLGDLTNPDARHANIIARLELLKGGESGGELVRAFGVERVATERFESHPDEGDS